MRRRKGGREKQAIGKLLHSFKNPTIIVKNVLTQTQTDSQANKHSLFLSLSIIK
jgi:hypothetical protein